MLEMHDLEIITESYDDDGVSAELISLYDIVTDMEMISNVDPAIVSDEWCDHIDSFFANERISEHAIDAAISRAGHKLAHNVPSVINLADQISDSVKDKLSRIKRSFGSTVSESSITKRLDVLNKRINKYKNKERAKHTPELAIDYNTFKLRISILESIISTFESTISSNVSGRLEDVDSLFKSTASHSNGMIVITNPPVRESMYRFHWRPPLRRRIVVVNEYNDVRIDELKKAVSAMYFDFEKRLTSTIKQLTRVATQSKYAKVIHTQADGKTTIEREVRASIALQFLLTQITSVVRKELSNLYSIEIPLLIRSTN